jgi:hypothetical protein
MRKDGKPAEYAYAGDYFICQKHKKLRYVAPFKQAESGRTLEVRSKDISTIEELGYGQQQQPQSVLKRQRFSSSENSTPISFASSVLDDISPPGGMTVFRNSSIP